MNKNRLVIPVLLVLTALVSCKKTEAIDKGVSLSLPATTAAPVIVIIRKPKGWQEILWGGNTCKICGCKMDKHGNKRISKK
ncbi:hypothetical protein [Lacinutrix jangbogonensis]|uniref:hypothetical protein n=1 Tax=Lacinutrix jangbogonensis TaxID=1469557 RepID=UPI00053E65AD|nr:hypothetical protein [Lacinutrix jangbogonensis]